MKTENELGLIHIYCGDGKGKTTAAMGLALRALGYGYRVLVVQFLKDGSSSELKALSTFPKASVISGKDVAGFSFAMNAQERLIVAQNHNDHLTDAIALCQNGGFDLLILDEVIGAMNADLIDCALLFSFLKSKPQTLEVAMTGRNPSEELIALADYVSELRKIKHPYDKGIGARGGIEL